MTRKDYVLIARALKDARSITVDRNGNSRSSTEWLAAVTSVSDALMRDNSRFDSARFLDACGAS